MVPYSYKTLSRSSLYAGMENKRAMQHSVFPQRDYSVPRENQPKHCESIEETGEGSAAEGGGIICEPTFDEKYGSICEIF